MKSRTYYTLAQGFTPRVIVHAGAAYLQELQTYQAMGARKVVWIEAVPELCALMPDTIAALGDGRVEHVWVQALITDRDGEPVEFHHFNNQDGSSSIFRSTEKLQERWRSVRETGKVSVLTSSRLDSVLAGLRVRPEEVDILVMDLQGAELLALKGAGAYLEHAAFVELEVSQEAIYDGGALFSDVDAYVQAAGFTRVSRLPWHGNVVYVRTDLLAREAFAALRAFASKRRAEAALPAGS